LRIVSRIGASEPVGAAGLKLLGLDRHELMLL
jgi:hypothetical protein